MRTFILSTLLLLFYNHAFSQCSIPVTKFDSCTYMSVGHRGYSSVYPENSLEALEELFKRGIRYSEIDVSLTKDKRYVLFHDDHSLFRTTNGQGDIGDFTLEALQQLDAGSWRGTQFAGTRIPTLEQALILAERYDAYLYLDCKSYNVPAMKTALTNTGVAANRLMPSIGNIADASAFRQQLPNTPWVWYSQGNYPDDVHDDNFYTQCIQLGCAAFEVSSGNVNDSLWNIFTGKVHSKGGKVWVFTANNDSILNALRTSGADGIESDRPWEAAKLICHGITGNSNDSLTTGNWKLEGNFYATGVGSQLRPLNISSAAPAQIPVFDSCSHFGIPLIGNKDKTVMKVTAMTPENGLILYNNFRVEDYGILDRSFTVIMDILLPTSSTNKWISLFQTSTGNINDADLFINPSGALGISQSYDGEVTPDEWHRIVFTVDGYTNKLRKYIDGDYVGENIMDGSRWFVWNSSRSGQDQGFLLFSDDDGETADLYVSALQVRNYVMNDAAVSTLGTAKVTGIASGNTDCWKARLYPAYTDSTLLDFENKTYHFVVPGPMADLDSAGISFMVAHGAKSSIPAETTINVSSGFYQWNITSEDGTRQTLWKACVRQTTPAVGMNDNRITSLPFHIYPNPADGSLNIETQSTLRAEYTLFSLQGAKLITGNLETGSGQLDVKDLAPGLYFIVVQEGDRKGIKKFIVAR